MLNQSGSVAEFFTLLLYDPDSDRIVSMAGPDIQIEAIRKISV